MNKFSVYLALFAVLSGFALASTIYVNNTDGTGCVPLGALNFPTIGLAYAASAPFDTIIVCNSGAAYAEALVVTTPVNIYGSQAGVQVVQGGPVAILQINGVDYVNVSNLSFVGMGPWNCLEIYNGHYTHISFVTTYTCNAGFYEDSASGYNHYEENTANSDKYGFYMTGTYSNLHDNYAYENNVHGFYVENDHNEFSWNTAYTNNYGFYVTASYNTLLHNTAYENSVGFYANGNYHLFENNQAYENTGDGFELYTYQSNYSNNSATSNANDCGFFLENDENRFLQNAANLNYYGFYVDDCVDNYFEDNSAGNNTYGFYLYEAEDNTFNMCSAEDNSNFAFYSEDGSNGNPFFSFDMDGLLVNFDSQDIALRREANPRTFTVDSGQPSIEIHNTQNTLGTRTRSVGVSDGDAGTSDITTFYGTTEFTGARAYYFDDLGNAAEVNRSIELTPITSPTYLWNGVSVDDSVAAEITLPFSVNMYGRLNDKIRISSNGFVYINSGVVQSSSSGCCSGQRMEDQTVTDGTDFLAAGLWTDLYKNATGPWSISYGVEGLARNRVFIIQFENVSQCCDEEGGCTFQIKFFENGTANLSSTGVPDPTGYRNINKYVYASANSGSDSWLDIEFPYTNGEISRVNENSLFIARYYALAWDTDPLNFASSYGVDTVNKYVYADIDQFDGIYAPMGTPGGTTQSSRPKETMSLSQKKVCPGNKLEITASDDDGAVKGAMVRLFLNGIGFGKVETDENGIATFVLDSAGKYKANANKGNYKQAELAEFDYSLCSATPTPTATPLPTATATPRPTATPTEEPSPTETAETQPAQEEEFLGEDAKNSLEEAGNAIYGARMNGKDVSEAEEKLREAQEAFAQGDYETAQFLAGQAKDLAESAVFLEEDSDDSSPATGMATTETAFPLVPLLAILVIIGGSAYYLFFMKK